VNSRERIKTALELKQPDSVPIHDSAWETTVQRWHKEGLPIDKTPAEYFNFELAEIQMDISLQLAEELVDETEDYIIKRTKNGALRKDWKHITSTPEMLDFRIKKESDWVELKSRLKMNNDRIDIDEQKKKYYESKKREKFICFASPMGYDYTQGIIGTENLLVNMVQNPDWIKDIFISLANLIVQGAKKFTELGFEFDGAFLFDDMGYRNAALFSPNTYKNVLYPAHKIVCNYFKNKNLPVILHSCGCVKEFIPFFIDLGINCLQPLEVKAGMDLIELKKQYGDKLAFMGGIDIRKMALPGLNAIEEEIKTKFEIAKKGGGYIYHCDHSIPDNVSFKRYKKIIKLVKKYGKY